MGILHGASSVFYVVCLKFPTKVTSYSRILSRKLSNAGKQYPISCLYLIPPPRLLTQDSFTGLHLDLRSSARNQDRIRDLMQVIAGALERWGFTGPCRNVQVGLAPRPRPPFTSSHEKKEAAFDITILQVGIVMWQLKSLLKRCQWFHYLGRQVVFFTP